MKNFLQISLIGGLIAIIIGYIGISNFDIFGEPKREIINSNCDYEGLRQIITYKYSSNAVTRPNIHVSASMSCSNKYDTNNEVVIFTADHHSITGDELTTEWISFDTLLISYDSTMRIFNKNDYAELTLPIIITYREK